MYIVGDNLAYVSKHFCTEVLRMYTLESSEKKCVTMEECREAGRYPMVDKISNGHMCVNKSQTSPAVCYVYAGTRTCDNRGQAALEDFDGGTSIDGIYRCGSDKYLYAEND